MLALNPYATAGELLADLRSGRVSVTEIVTLYRERRDQLQSQVNAIVTPDDSAALEQARRLDRACNLASGPLAGLPVTIKDGIHVKGLASTGGILEPAACIAAADAPCVRRLREAGALILGKTNVPPGNGDWQTNNRLFGRTCNPWNQHLTPGGSTGGGAAAVAAGLTGAELGSDIGGSIRIPAAFCGIYGHKPSTSALPRSGHFPGGNTFNSAAILGVQGPLARSARDLERLFEVLCGSDGLEGKGWQPALPPPRFEHLKDCRVGVLKLPAWLPVDEAILCAQDTMLERLRSAGTRTCHVDVSAHFGDYSDVYRQYLVLLQCYMGATLAADARASAAEKMRRYQDPFLDAVAEGLTANAGRMLNALEAAEDCRNRWETVFHDIDVLLSPVCSSNAFAHDDRFFYDRVLPINGAAMPYYRLSALPSIASFAGLPATVFPSGELTDIGTPIGLQVMGAYLEDRSTLRFAALVEQAIAAFAAPPGLK